MSMNLKRCIAGFITVLMMAVVTTGCLEHGEETKVPSTKEIADSFNSSNYFEKFDDYECKASATENTVNLSISIVHSNGETKEVELEYLCKDEVLCYDAADDEEAFTYAAYFMYVVDAANHVMGNEYGATLEYLSGISSDDEAMEKFGITSDVESKSLSYDLTKKIDIPKTVEEQTVEEQTVEEQTDDESDLFVSLDDLAQYKGIMEDKNLISSGKRVGDSHVVFIPKGNKVTVLSSDKYEINDNTYKSLLSAIEILFENHKATDYFYSHFRKNEDVSFEGFKVEINPKKNKTEKENLKKEDFIRVTIDWKAAKKAIENEKYDTTDSIEELYDKISEGSKKTVDGYEILDSTSKDNILTLTLKFMIVPVCIVAVVFVVFKIVHSSIFSSGRRSTGSNIPTNRDAAGENRFRRVMGVSEETEETVKEAELSEEDLMAYEKMNADIADSTVNETESPSADNYSEEKNNFEEENSFEEKGTVDERNDSENEDKTDLLGINIDSSL